jgi:hypothetical protein
MNKFTVTIKIEASAEPAAIAKSQLVEKIANHADIAVLQKIAELIEKPNAGTKFLNALNNPFIKKLF